LTLTEVLVVVAILGLLAAGAAPVAHLILDKAKADDAAGRLRDAWRLALAAAQARGEPTLLTITAGGKAGGGATGEGEAATVTVADRHRAPLWTAKFTAAGLSVTPAGGTPISGAAEVAVFPHGLVTPVRVAWRGPRGPQAVTLPPDLPATAFAETVAPLTETGGAYGE
jgi:prepilin-type N-terminal cleavage/methylation domain-containing protein